MKKTLFHRIGLRSWDLMMLQSFSGVLVALLCIVYFRTYVALLFFSAFSGLLIFQWLLRCSIKKRSCEKGTIAEADAETYLLRGNDGSELRVPKNSKWIFVEQRNGNAESVLFLPVYEFSNENGNAVPAPDIQTQQPPPYARKFIAGILLVAAGTILISWILGKYLPLSPRIIHYHSCTCHSSANHPDKSAVDSAEN